jgi:hypothetical protein
MRVGCRALVDRRIERHVRWWITGEGRAGDEQDGDEREAT